MKALSVMIAVGVLACAPGPPAPEPKLVPPYPGTPGKWGAPNDYGAPTPNATRCPPLPASTPRVDDGGGRSIPCKVAQDCWVDEAKKPVARPADARGRDAGYCDAPACQDGFCVVLHR